MATDTVILNCARMDPTVAAVGHIARLQLGMRRGGYTVRVANVSDELKRVIELTGLLDCLGVEVQGQVEQWEEPGGVEEEGDLPDPAA